MIGRDAVDYRLWRWEKRMDGYGTRIVRDWAVQYYSNMWRRNTVSDH